MSNEITLHQNPNPDENELNAIMRQAEILASSDIVPAAYKRKPGNAVAAALMGRSFGWDGMTAMRFIQVIQGNATLKPEAMLALVRSRGHSVQIVRMADGVKVTGTRADTGDTDTVTFTLEDAKRANLLSNGTWKQYPIDMCQWRAVSRICRSLFADVTLGAAYTPEELALAKGYDADVEKDGSVSRVGPAVTAPNAITPEPTPAIPEFTNVDAARAYWVTRSSAGASKAELDDIAAIAKALKELEPVDAEIVEDTTSETEAKLAEAIADVTADEWGITPDEAAAPATPEGGLV